MAKIQPDPETHPVRLMKAAEPEESIGRKNRFRIAMVKIFVNAQAEDGTDLRHSTWALGLTPARAVASWKKGNVAMAERFASHEVVTSGERLPGEYVPTTRVKLPGSPRGVR